jgi:anti-sigma-K factor RskA
MNLLQPERLHALAREYALGTLHGGARRRFERLLRSSGAARVAVAHWQEQFAALAAAVPPMVPRDAVWRGLEKRLGFGNARAAAAAAAEPWWQRWFGARVLGGAVAGALVALVAGTLVLQSNPGWIGHETLREDLPASYVGLLSDNAGQPALLLSSRRQGRVLSAKLLKPLQTPPGRVAVLWAFPKGGAAPFAVGTISAATGTVKLPLADTSEKLFFSVERLGLSFEPAGPAPAAPGSELVLAGPCVKLW